MTEWLRERLNRSPLKSLAQYGEPAQAPLLTGVRRLRKPPVSQRRTHRRVTLGAGSQAVQDTIGSTPDGGSKNRPRLP